MDGTPVACDSTARRLDAIEASLAEVLSLLRPLTSSARCVYTCRCCEGGGASPHPERVRDASLVPPAVQVGASSEAMPSRFAAAAPNDVHSLSTSSQGDSAMALHSRIVAAVAAQTQSAPLRTSAPVWGPSGYSAPSVLLAATDAALVNRDDAEHVAPQARKRGSSPLTCTSPSGDDVEMSVVTSAAMNASNVDGVDEEEVIRLVVDTVDDGREGSPCGGASSGGPSGSPNSSAEHNPRLLATSSSLNHQSFSRSFTRGGMASPLRSSSNRLITVDRFSFSGRLSGARRQSKGAAGPTLEACPDGTQQLSLPKRQPTSAHQRDSFVGGSSGARYGKYNVNSGGAASASSFAEFTSRGLSARLLSSALDGPSVASHSFAGAPSPTSAQPQQQQSLFDTMPSLHGDPTALLSMPFWTSVRAWLCTFPTLEAKHFIVVGLDLIYVLGTTVITILVLSLVTVSAFDRVPMSDADWRLDASMILPFELFFCVWMLSRPFVRVRSHHWTVLDTVPAIARHYYSSGWLWFDVAVSVPWGLPYYFGAFGELAFSLLTVVHLTRWLRCFRLNYSSHPLQPSKLGFRLFVTFCAIVSGVHALAVMFPVMDLRSHTEFSYLDCLYYVVVTMVSVGYGDITPRNASGKGFAVFIIMAGVACISLFTAALTQYLNRTDGWQYELEGKRRMLRKMLGHYSVPWGVQKQLMLKVPEAHQAQKNAEFLRTIAAFPSSVADKVVLYVLAKALCATVPLLHDEAMRSLLMEVDGEEDESVAAAAGAIGGKGATTAPRRPRPFATGVVRRGGSTEDNFTHSAASRGFWHRMHDRWRSRHSETYIPRAFRTKEFPVALELAARMRRHSFGASAVVFECGDIGREMYFVTSGVVELIPAPMPTVITHSCGRTEAGPPQPLSPPRRVQAMEAFGESALLDDTVRTATARCVEDCEVYSLHQAEVDALAAAYPWLQDRLEEELAMVIRAVRRSAIFAVVSAAREEASRPATIDATGSAYVPLPITAGNLNPAARAVLGRSRAVDILTDVPLSAFDAIGR